MTDNIKELEEKLRIAKEEKIISEGGFRCVRCGRVLDIECRFTLKDAKPLWVIDLQPDNLEEMCISCVEDQFRYKKCLFFKDLEPEPNNIEIVKVEFTNTGNTYTPRTPTNKTYLSYDFGRIHKMVFRVDDKYFELKNFYDPYDEDNELRFNFIGREGDENVKEILKS